MAKDIIPQELLIYRRVLVDALNKVTNEMYADNIKVSFNYSFTLVKRESKPTVFLNTAKPLYLFRVAALDKSNNPVGTEHFLYNNYYPKDIDTSVYQLERKAIQDWVTNGWKALYNTIHTDYIEQAKKRQEVQDRLTAEGVTLQTVKDQIALTDAKRIAEQEAKVLKFMHPDIK
jgi:hypothetical protein